MYSMGKQNIDIYQKARIKMVINYSLKNSITWSVINISIDKNCSNSNIFINQFHLIISYFKCIDYTERKARRLQR